ncbi:MAG: hypothetical protein AMXMBFR53_03300 [Gemmatimonadota bacterium]
MTPRILIIDDDPEILRALRRILEAGGYEVQEAADGRTALRHFAGHPTDVVLTDIFMPEMDGIEFIMRVKEAFPEARVVAMSGGGLLPSGSVLGAAAHLGAEAVLAKPFTIEEVLEAVGRALEGPGAAP